MTEGHSHRSITLIVQNDTHGEFRVDGHATIHGDWETEPKSGDIIEPQSAAKWKIASRAEQEGASGYIHLSCVGGDIKISVNRPWAGETHYAAELPEGYAAQSTLDNENPDCPVVVIEIRTSVRK